MMTNPRSLAVSTLALLALAMSACGDFAGTAQGSQSGPGQVFDPAAIPGGQAAFETTLYPLMVQYCVDCHAGQGPGSPHMAHPSVATAYTETMRQNKVNLGTPGASRVVRKLVDEGHNCWSDCASDGAALQAAIALWADMVDFGEGGVTVDESLSSLTQTLADGSEDVGSERYSDNVIALWDFKEGTGTVAHDVSGVPPAIDLTLGAGITWLTSWGIQIEDGMARANVAPSRKLYDRIADSATGTGQYTVEAWVTNADTARENSRIITYSSGGARNFALGQEMYNYNFRNRSVAADIGGGGTPALETYDADQDLQATLQHVVITYDAFRGRRIYVDGRWTDDVDPVQPPGRLWNWDRNFPFALGNDPNGEDRQWEGQVRLIAIYDRALTDAQILQNFNAGVGRRLLMRFDVGRWAGAGSFIEFQVSEFDNGSYMFCAPTFRTPTPAGYQLANIRIAVNGVVAPTGQAFVTIDTPITEQRQALSTRCSVIPKVNGAAGDQFSIVFEHLGGFQNVETEPTPIPFTVILDPGATPGHGVRDFARIRETMATVTGVSSLVPDIDATFGELEQQLPSEFEVRSFVSSHQVGIAKLSVEYCDALVDNTGLRDAFFGAFPWTTVPETVFADPARRTQVADALYNRMYGTGLAGQPTLADTRAEVSSMIDGLLVSCPCAASRTPVIVKGACTAVLSSAAISMH
jgi:hypothetical protein